MLNIPTNPLTVRIEGEGGRGGSSIGEILARAAARCGYHIQCSRAFPAEIKGGRAWFQIRLSDQPVLWWGGTPDLELSDTRQGDWELRCRIGSGSATQVLRAPVSPLKIARDGGTPRDANLVALGLVAATLGLDPATVLAAAGQRYSRRGTTPTGLADRIRCGYEAAESAVEWVRWGVPPPQPAVRRLVLNGNEAVALGALAAGVRFFCGYPITPASSILEFMLGELPKLGGTALQMEDEMAALAACLGAAYAGKRAMVATSGPGFALMSELLNLAVNAEIPVTVVDVQRSGPATGQPSRSEQADLLYAIYGSPGDSPRAVVAPSDVREAFELTFRAVNWAESRQMPVIVLSDGALSNRIEAVPEPDWDALAQVRRLAPPAGRSAAGFARYEPAPDGVSPMPLPGRDDLPYVAGGMEHSSDGQPSASAHEHRRMSRKRLAKLESLAAEFEADTNCDGLVPGVRVGIIGWGSTRGAIAEATDRLRRQGYRLASVHLRFLNPLPGNRLSAWMSRLDTVIVAEENHTGQLAQLLRRLAPGKITSLFPDENDFELTPERVIEGVGEVAGKEPTLVEEA